MKDLAPPRPVRSCVSVNESRSNGQLRARTQTADKWQKIPLDKQEIMYRKFVLIGQQRGYSPKWAPVRFKSMFGRWPDFDKRKMEAYA